ncbi:MAG: hypothetical protein ACI9WU_004089 [Myxococcota bacterium]|jgi:hypothetical protein
MLFHVLITATLVATPVAPQTSVVPIPTIEPTLGERLLKSVRGALIDEEALGQVVSVAPPAKAWPALPLDAFGWEGLTGRAIAVHKGKRRLAIVGGKGHYDCAEQLHGREIRFNGSRVSKRVRFGVLQDCGDPLDPSVDARYSAWLADLKARGYEPLEAAIIGRNHPDEPFASTVVVTGGTLAGHLLHVTDEGIDRVDIDNEVGRAWLTVPLDTECWGENGEEEPDDGAVDCMLERFTVSQIYDLGQGYALINAWIDGPSCHVSGNGYSEIRRLR